MPFLLQDVWLLLLVQLKDGSARSCSHPKYGAGGERTVMLHTEWGRTLKPSVRLQGLGVRGWSQALGLGVWVLGSYYLAW